MPWVGFTVSACLVVLAGTRLVKYADLLSDRLALSKVWIGVILLGFVTSLPEAVTSLTAVISFEATDLSVGNMLGSNVYNIMIIVLMDCLYRKGSITSQFDFNRSNILPSVFASLITLIVIIEIFLSLVFNLPAIGYMSAGCILIAVFYLWGMWVLFSIRSIGSDGGAIATLQTPHEESLSKIFLNLIFASALVFFGSIGLTIASEALAQTTGLGRMFVGSIFLALATSLPEIVVSLAALIIGSFSLAIGNIFGSNMINLFIIFLSGLFYPKGPILASVSPSHILTAALGIVLTCVAVYGIKLKKKKILFGVGFDSILMFVCFILGMSFLYQLK